MQKLSLCNIKATRNYSGRGEKPDTNYLYWNFSPLHSTIDLYHKFINVNENMPRVAGCISDEN